MKRLYIRYLGILYVKYIFIIIYHWIEISQGILLRVSILIIIII